MGHLNIGVDIGQLRDPSAIVIAESSTTTVVGDWERPQRGGVVHPKQIKRSTERITTYVVRHLERLPLGTPYPDIAQRIATVAIRAGRIGGMRPTLYLDSTGVGKPVVDLVRTALRGSNVVIQPVVFTSGDNLNLSGDQGTLGKGYLVNRLQVLLQTGRLKLPQTSEAHALAAELMDYEIRVSQAGRDSYGAFRSGSHDDLVTALALATLETADRRMLVF